MPSPKGGNHYGLTHAYCPKCKREVFGVECDNGICPMCLGDLSCSNGEREGGAAGDIIPMIDRLQDQERPEGVE